MICKKCGLDSLDAWAGGVCPACERSEKMRRDDKEAGCLIVTMLVVFLCVVIWGAAKFIAVVKYICT